MCPRGAAAQDVGREREGGGLAPKARIDRSGRSLRIGGLRSGSPNTPSSFVAGGYASGTRIKFTQAPGSSPNVKPGPGVIDWHITLKGDAGVTATDGSGNSASVICRVPSPPK